MNSDNVMKRLINITVSKCCIQLGKVHYSRAMQTGLSFLKPQKGMSGGTLPPGQWKAMPGSVSICFLVPLYTATIQTRTKRNEIINREQKTCYHQMSHTKLIYIINAFRNAFKHLFFILNYFYYQARYQQFNQNTFKRKQLLFLNCLVTYST